MDTFKIWVELSNAAFDDDPRLELSRILSELSQRVLSEDLDEARAYQRIRDINGNTVGCFRIEN